MRNDECAKLFCDYVKKCAFIEKPKLDQKMRKPNYATLQIIDDFKSNA